MFCLGLSESGCVSDFQILMFCRAGNSETWQQTNGFNLSKRYNSAAHLCSRDNGHKRDWGEIMNTNRSLASLFFLGLTFPPDLLLSGLNPNLREPTSSSSALLLNRIPSEMEVALCYSLLPLFRLFQLHYTADTLAGMVIRLECCWMQALQASEQKRDGVYGWWTRWSGYPLDCLTTSAPVVLKRLVIFITFWPSQPRNWSFICLQIFHTKRFSRVSSFRSSVLWEILVDKGSWVGDRDWLHINHILLDDDDNGNDYVQTLGTREVPHSGRCSWEHCNDRAALPPSLVMVMVRMRMMAMPSMMMMIRRIAMILTRCGFDQ